jgi:hypothetical protein
MTCGDSSKIRRCLWMSGTASSNDQLFDNRISGNDQRH